MNKYSGFWTWLCNNQQVEGQESAITQHPRRPALSSLQVPERTMADSFSNFTRIDNPSPSSTRSGLPPRPHSAKFISSVRNLLPQKSTRVKNASQDGEKTVLIVPDTPLSDKPPDRPSTSRSFSLNKILFSQSATSAHSLPVTPTANTDAKGVDGTQSNHNSELPVSSFLIFIGPEVLEHLSLVFFCLN